jgi:hypothetical protein
MVKDKVIRGLIAKIVPSVVYQRSTWILGINWGTAKIKFHSIFPPNSGSLSVEEEFWICHYG